MLVLAKIHGLLQSKQQLFWKPDRASENYNIYCSLIPEALEPYRLPEGQNGVHIPTSVT
jgi:hypothetical protein